MNSNIKLSTLSFDVNLKDNNDSSFYPPLPSPSMQVIRDASNGLLSYNTLPPQSNLYNTEERLRLRVDQPVEGVKCVPHSFLRDNDEKENPGLCSIEYRWFKSSESLRCAFKDCPYSSGNRATPSIFSKIQCIECAHANRSRGESSFCSTDCFKMGWLLHKKSFHSNGNNNISSNINISKNPSSEEILIDPKRLPPVKGESWLPLSSDKTYFPKKEDVGHVLKVECIAHSDSDGKIICNKIVETCLVLPAASPVLPRRLISSKNNRNTGLPTFRVVTYNVLADIYGTTQLYPYCPVWALKWNYRRGNILRELLDFNGDILCLQEVQADHFEKFLYPELKRCNFEGLYKAKTRPSLGQEGKVDGCALFFRTDRFKLKEKYVIEFNEVATSWKDSVLKSCASSLSPVALLEKEKQIKRGLARLSKDNIAQIVVLEILGNGANKTTEQSRICIANTHIFWDPDYPDVKLWQTNMLIKELEKFTAARQVPLILCGDLNSEPSSSVYEFLSLQSVSPDHVDLEKDTCNVLPHVSEISHGLPLASAYNSVANSEPEHTNFTGHYKGVLDYIWYSNDSLLPLSVVEVPNAKSLYGVCNSALPNPVYSSDHVSLAFDFAIPQKRGGRK